jgi:tellurite resistance protein TerC
VSVVSVGSPWLWTGFIAFVLAMLALDLGVFHRKAHVVSAKEAGAWTLVWVALAGAFAVALHVWVGAERALEFTTGYLIEKALAVDNIFVFVVIFGAFSIPPVHQHRVLFWGVLGALAMRAAFVLGGSAFLHRFSWSLYAFGALLVATGLKLLVARNQPTRPADNPIVRALRRFVPVVEEDQSGQFTLRRGGRRFATPLLLALVAVEVTDLIFAVDSIPAIFSVTSDPFIVFTANIFAILGLRSMYFLLAGVIERFANLKVGLAAVLVFVGGKMLLVDVVKVPTSASLGVIAAILGTAVVSSLVWSGRRRANGRVGAVAAPRA